MQTLLYVGIGGAVGAMARYLVGVQALRTFGSGWPYGTFAVNIAGGLLMGLLAGVLAHRGGLDQERWRLLLGVGVLGGFTTFSAFSLELALMLEKRAFTTAAVYALASVVLSTLALFAGLLAARRVFA
ncbi:fluoride efflux transporter CrcB [Phenylobacterium sp.]|uniref:fluoride efflux transporter CrcB n=1 Tax=Phenylobacterium sp. TaxID=1871053 RepID=UPI002BAD0280|nr:fluoride efflux transporter CrcB [Phenylobacterium sp.]HVI30722.1 fluoride efflux transporter CrcB [Phenylobacterium sp.]